MTILSLTNLQTDPLGIPEKRIVIDKVLEEYRSTPGATMVILNELQTKIGFITEPMQSYIARKLKVPVGTIHGVVTFYSFFTTQPRGKHTVKFCMGTACYVGGAPQLIEKVKQLTGSNIGSTTSDGNITLEVCRCVGACSQAPVVVVDEEVQGRVRPNKLPQVLRKCQEEAAS
jgi:NADH:ubiquinone oxidoreductase subunit E